MRLFALQVRNGGAGDQGSNAGMERRSAACAHLGGLDAPTVSWMLDQAHAIEAEAVDYLNVKMCDGVAWPFSGPELNYLQ